MIPDWVMLHEKLWVTAAAWFGILFVPALIGSLWVPDLIERLWARNAAILDERERQANR